MLNTLSSILTLSNTLKVRVMKERVVEKSAEKSVEEEEVKEEKPEEEKPEEEEEKPEEEKKEEEEKPAEEKKEEEVKEEEKPAEEEKEEEEKEEVPTPLNPSHSVEIKLRGSVEDDVARLSSLLSHAVTQQFNVLTRLRKFMDNAGPLADSHA